MNGAGCNVLWNSTVKPWWEGDEDGVADAVRLLEAAAATIRAEVHPDQNALLTPCTLRSLTHCDAQRRNAQATRPLRPTQSAPDREGLARRWRGSWTAQPLRRTRQAAATAQAGSSSRCSTMGGFAPSPPAAHTSKHAHQRSPNGTHNGARTYERSRNSMRACARAHADWMAWVVLGSMAAPLATLTHPVLRWR